MDKIQLYPTPEMESKELLAKTPELDNVTETGWSLFYSPYFGEMRTNNPMYEPMMVIEIYRKRLLALVQERNHLFSEINELKAMVKTYQQNESQRLSSSESTASKKNCILFGSSNMIPLHPNPPTAITTFAETTKAPLTDTNSDVVVHIPSDLLK